MVKMLSKAELAALQGDPEVELEFESTEIENAIAEIKKSIAQTNKLQKEIITVTRMLAAQSEHVRKEAEARRKEIVDLQQALLNLPVPPPIDVKEIVSQITRAIEKTKRPDYKFDIVRDEQGETQSMIATQIPPRIQ